MESNKPVTVVILNWNGEKLLRKFLFGVVENTDPRLADVVVADNGSTDGSVAYVREMFPQVGVIQLDRNYGFAEGYNLAIRQVTTPYVVLLNSDVLPMPGWIDTLTAYMEAHPDVGAVQPKILSYNQPSLFEYAGASGGFLDRHGYPFCRGRLFDTCEADRHQYDDPIPVFWASGAALMIRTDLYRKAGGLDPRFFAHMEEIDLCWRVLLMGCRIMAVPEAEVLHVGGGSLPASNPRKTYLNFRNNLLLLHKNLPDSTRRRKLLVRRLIDTLAFAKFALTFDFANARAVWRAHRDFAKMRRDYTDHPDRDLLDEWSEARVDIVVQYYLRGKRTFKQLFR